MEESRRCGGRNSSQQGSHSPHSLSILPSYHLLWLIAHPNSSFLRNLALILHPREGWSLMVWDVGQRTFTSPELASQADCPSETKWWVVSVPKAPDLSPDEKRDFLRDFSHFLKEKVSMKTSGGNKIFFCCRGLEIKSQLHSCWDPIKTFERQSRLSLTLTKQVLYQ